MSHASLRAFVAQIGWEFFLDAIASPSTYPSDLPQAKVSRNRRKQKVCRNMQDMYNIFTSELSGEGVKRGVRPLQLPDDDPMIHSSVTNFHWL